MLYWLMFGMNVRRPMIPALAFPVARWRDILASAPHHFLTQCVHLQESAMTRLPAVLNPTDEDIQMLLACNVHLGTKNSTAAMEPYIFKRRTDGSLPHRCRRFCIFLIILHLRR